MAGDGVLVICPRLMKCPQCQSVVASPLETHTDIASRTLTFQLVEHVTPPDSATQTAIVVLFFYFSYCRSNSIGVATDIAKITTNDTHSKGKRVDKVTRSPSIVQRAIAIPTNIAASRQMCRGSSS